ncbi:MAG: insulinase family protein [Phycisphaerales bacterium]|nr:insulinase family protein [Phycisphaerales bacterium]
MTAPQQKSGPNSLDVPRAGALADNLMMHTLSCGMRLALERSSTVSSVGVAWLLPVGSAGDPDGAAGEGESTLLAELITRGAGDLDSRAFSEALDRVGAQRSCGTTAYHTLATMTVLGSRIGTALDLLCTMVRNPRLDADALEPARSLALQSLASLADDPAHLVMLRLAGIALPAPFNRTSFGHADGLKALTLEGLRAAWARRCVPRGSILGIAGAIEPQRIIDQLERRLAGWGGEFTEPVPTATPSRGVLHVPQQSAQAHIGLAIDAPPEGDPQSLVHRLAVKVIGGGMSSRLFTEVREKRGLCYSVGMSYAAGRDRGISQVYAGSTPERAARTLECIRTELARAASGVSAEEFAGAIVGLKSRLVMQGESSLARASAIAGDVFRTGRPRSLAEMAAEADRISLGSLNEHMAQAFGADRISQASLAVVGPAALQ